MRCISSDEAVLMKQECNNEDKRHGEIPEYVWNADLMS